MRCDVGVASPKETPVLSHASSGSFSRNRRRRSRPRPSFSSTAPRNDRPVRTAPRQERAAPAAVEPAPIGGFADLGLSDRLQKAVAAAGYSTPTPIQNQAIPHVVRGKDLLGAAQTGTGKTAAFALPILERLGGNPARGTIRALVLAPTRELAAQIAESFATFGASAKLRTLVVFGGVSKHGQVQALRRGADILVATPGRLLDLLRDRALDLGEVESFVLDEADRMLDMGFIHDVKRIVGHLPRERQTLMFSATMPPAIDKLASSLLRDPVRVAVDPISSTREPIAQSLYFVEKAGKTRLLVQILESEEMESVLVFTRTKHGANRLVRNLEAAGRGAAAIHGNKSQAARTRALDDFKRGRIGIIVATDIAARGIDIQGLSHVVNFDLPNEPESYVHRIGRTGRAGRSGVAISFCASDERAHLRAIERLTRRKLEVVSQANGAG